MFKRILILAVAAVWLSLADAGVTAQNSTNSSANSNTISPSPSPAPTLIPFAAFVTESERALAKSREIEAFLAEQLIPASIADGIEGTRAEIDQLAEATNAAATDRFTLESIAAAERDWQTVRNKLSGWMTRNQSQSSAIESRIIELRAIKENWQASKAAIADSPGSSDGSTGEGDGVPEEVLRRADSVLAAVTNVERQAVAKRAEFLTLESRLSGLQSDVSKAIADLKQEREKQLVNVFSMNDRPIWAADWSELSRQNFRSAAGGSLAEQWQEFLNYTSRVPYRFAWHGVLLGALIIFLFWVRRKILPFVEKEPKLSRPAAFFKLPVASALIVSVFFAAFLYPQSPRLLTTMIGAAAIIPGFLILRRIIESPLHYLLYGLLGLYIIDRVRDLLIDLPLASRLLFSIEMLAACIILIWFYRSKRVENNVEAGAHIAFRSVRRFAPVGVAVFGIALVANLFGYVSIAYLVGNGLLRSAYLAIFLYTAVQIFASAVAFVLRVRPLSATGAVRNSRALIRQRVTQILNWTAVLLWVIGVLNLFSIRDVFFATLGSALNYKFYIGEISLSIGNILLFVAVVWVSVLVSRFVRFILEEDVYPRVNVGGGSSFAISSVVHYLFLIGGFLIAVAAVGFELSRFAIVAGAIGLGLGFGLQNIVNNFVSGLILLFERPVKVGDTVQIGQHMGSLKSIGLRASVVRKVDGSDVIVPNSHLISNEVINWTMLDERRRIDIPVGVAYGTDPKVVTELLIRLTDKYKDILTDPAPKALFIGLGESSLDFELRVWTEDTVGWVGMRSELVTDVYNSLNEAGIEIPFPQRDVNLRSRDKPAKENR